MRGQKSSFQFFRAAARHFSPFPRVSATAFLFHCSFSPRFSEREKTRQTHFVLGAARVVDSFVAETESGENRGRK